MPFFKKNQHLYCWWFFIRSSTYNCQKVSVLYVFSFQRWEISIGADFNTFAIYTIELVCIFVVVCESVRHIFVVVCVLLCLPSCRNFWWPSVHARKTRELMSWSKKTSASRLPERVNLPIPPQDPVVPFVTDDDRSDSSVPLVLVGGGEGGGQWQGTSAIAVHWFMVATITSSVAAPARFTRCLPGTGGAAADRRGCSLGVFSIQEILEVG